MSNCGWGRRRSSARIEDDRLVLDLRTVFEEEEEELRVALVQARSR